MQHYLKVGGKTTPKEVTISTIACSPTIVFRLVAFENADCRLRVLNTLLRGVL